MVMMGHQVLFTMGRMNYPTDASGGLANYCLQRQFLLLHSTAGACGLASSEKVRRVTEWRWKRQWEMVIVGRHVFFILLQCCLQ